MTNNLFGVFSTKDTQDNTWFITSKEEVCSCCGDVKLIPLKGDYQRYGVCRACYSEIKKQCKEDLSDFKKQGSLLRKKRYGLSKKYIIQLRSEFAERKEIIRKRHAKQFLISSFKISRQGNKYLLIGDEDNKLFIKEVLPLLKVLFPKKDLELSRGRYEVILSVCDLNLLYDHLGYSGDNICIDKFSNGGSIDD